MIAVAVGAGRIFVDYAAVGATFAVPFFDEGLVSEGIFVGGMTGLAKRADLRPAPKFVGGNNVRFVVAVVLR